jgi:sugar (pentulose or hexulose) kinase
VIDATAAILGRPVEALDGLAADAPPVELGDVLDDLAHGGAVALPDAPDGEVWAGLLDALTARTADAYHRLTMVVGGRDRLVVFGGGSRSVPWTRAKVAAMPVPVVRSTVSAAVASGAALYAGLAAGWWASVEEAPTPPTAAG